MAALKRLKPARVQDRQDRDGRQRSRPRILALQIRRLDIEAKEPPIYRVLDVICHNEVAKALGKEKYRVKVTRLQRLFKNIFDIRADRFGAGFC